MVITVRVITRSALSDHRRVGFFFFLLYPITMNGDSDYAWWYDGGCGLCCVNLCACVERLPML